MHLKIWSFSGSSGGKSTDSSCSRYMNGQVEWRGGRQGAAGRIAFAPATMELMQCTKATITEVGTRYVDMLPNAAVVSKAETSSAEPEVMFDMGRWGYRWKSRQMLGRMLWVRNRKRHVWSACVFQRRGEKKRRPELFVLIDAGASVGAWLLSQQLED